MKSSYVLSKFLALTDATNNLRTFISVSPGERIRIMSLSWLPNTEYAASSATRGIDLYNGLPDGHEPDGTILHSVTDKLAYRTERQSSTMPTPVVWERTVQVFPEMPSHGLLFTDTIYAVGRGDGAYVLFATYQSG